MSSARRRLRRSAKKKGSRGAIGPESNAIPDAPQGRSRRVHLKVVTDPSSRARVELVRPIFSEKWQDQLVAEMAETFYAILSEARTLDEIVAVGKRAMDATTAKVDEILALAPPGAVACRQGCDHCCHQRVGVTPAEALTILAHVLTGRSKDEVEMLAARLAQAAERTNGLSSADRFSPDLPCPFLHEQSCSIYEVRPLSCRGVHSLDARTCETNLNDPVQRRAYLEGQTPGHFFVEPFRAVHAISAALQLTLSECFAFDMQPLDLILVMSALLNDASLAIPDDERLPQSWLAGKTVFGPMRGGDASDRGAMMELAGVRPAFETNS